MAFNHQAKKAASMKKRKIRLQGLFQLANAQEAYGELLIKGKKSILTLTSQSELPSMSDENVLHGKTVDAKKVSCIYCEILSQGNNWAYNEFTHHLAYLFPHFVTVGHEHIDPALPVVHSIEFTVDDLRYLFYDFDAFGSVSAANDIIGPVLVAANRTRKIETGDHPMVAYFAGKLNVIEVETEIGKMIVWRQLANNTGGPKGISIKNRIAVTLEMETPVTFEKAIDRMTVITRFLSMMAGRRQIGYDIKLRTSTDADQSHRLISAYWTSSPKAYKSQAENFKPDIRSVPINPINELSEFSMVFKDWVCRDANWRISRIRYENCLSNGDYYDTNRLIAAANSFDILPPNAVPREIPLSDDLTISRNECLKIIKRCPHSYERDSAIQALKRMGKPSLKRKILHRAAMLKECIYPEFNEIETVIDLAVKCRNYFVHGPSDDFNFTAVEPFQSFFTNTLEFIFAASDLIEAGWDASK